MWLYHLNYYDSKFGPLPNKSCPVGGGKNIIAAMRFIVAFLIAMEVKRQQSAEKSPGGFSTAIAGGACITAK